MLIVLETLNQSTMMALRARSAPCSRRQRLQLRRQCARGRGQQRKRRQRNRLPTGSRAHSFSCIVFMFAYLACSTQSSCFHLFHFQSHIFIFPNFLFQIRSKSINQSRAFCRSVPSGRKAVLYMLDAKLVTLQFFIHNADPEICNDKTYVAYQRVPDKPGGEPQSRTAAAG